MVSHGDPIRILYVGDEPGFGESLATEPVSDGAGYEVRTETHASGGLDRFAAERAAFDCVVVEYELPGDDGLEFLRAVGAADSVIPFVLVALRGSEAVASEAISAGVSDYVRTDGDPDDVSRLADRIERAVDRSRDRREDRLARHRLEELTESTTDCLWVFDGDWEELLYISGYEEVWNRPVESIEDDPRDFLQGIHPEDRPRMESGMERISGGASLDEEYRILRGDDETGWVWVKGEPVYDDEGNVVRVAGFTRDVTERKRRERDLELRTRAINEAPVGVMITDPDREDNPVVYANDGFEDLTQYAEAEALGRNPRFLQGPLTDGDPVERMREAIDAREAVETDILNYRKNGTPFWNHVQLTPVFDEIGGLSHFIGFQNDVTSRVEHERRTTLLNRVLRHNIRNNLNVILGNLSRLEGADVPEEPLAATRQSADRLLEVSEKAREIEPILRTTSFSPERRRLESVLDRALETATEPIDDVAVRLDVDPRTAVLAPEAITVAIGELLDNAVKHADEPAADVTVAARADTIPFPPEDDRRAVVVVEIADANERISDLDRRRLLGEEETSVEHGAGLGLWLVHWLVTMSGGLVDYEQRSPRGNRVSITVLRPMEPSVREEGTDPIDASDLV